MHEGVPQGAVLSPLLFILFVNDIVDKLQAGTHVSIFADDIGIWRQDIKKERAAEHLQKDVDTITSWSKEWRLTLNCSKCESGFFSSDSNEAHWSPTINITNKDNTQSVLHHNKNPVLLGVTYDRTLTFGKQVDKVIAKMSGRFNVLRALSSTSWGWNVSLLRDTYIALIRSIAEYASPSWAPWISATNLKRLETTQLKALRVITKAFERSPREAVLLEAGVCFLTTRYRQLAAIAYERTLRLDQSFARHSIIQHEAKQRTKKTDWRSHSKDLVQAVMGPISRDTDTHNAQPPWDPVVNVSYTITDINKSRPEHEQQDTAIRTLNSVANVDLWVYTDGSVNPFGGAGMACYLGPDHISGQPIHEAHFPAGNVCSSFRAESVAVLEATNWLSARDNWSTAAIVTDSLSLISRLKSGPTTEPIICRINANFKSMSASSKFIHMIWIPGHCEVPGNVRADLLAGLAAGSGNAEIPVSKDTALSKIKLVIKDPDPVHPRVKRIYTCGINHKLEDRLTRQSKVNLTRFRTGHHPQLQAFRHRLDPDTSPMCRLCHNADEDAEHIWCHCPGTLAVTGTQQPLSNSPTYSNSTPTDSSHYAHTNRAESVRSDTHNAIINSIITNLGSLVSSPMAASSRLNAILELLQ